MSTAPQAVAAPEQLSMKEVLRLPAMRRLWYAQIVSNFGDFVALFAVLSILTFQMNGTPAQVTGVQIFYLAPIAVLGLLAGVFVDRWPLKPTLIASDFLRAGLVLLLLAAGSPGQFYVVLAGISVVSSFFGPAQQVAIRSIVPLTGLRAANSLMQQVLFIMRIVGPATAAFLVAKFGAHFCYLADSLSFLASGCLIATVTLARPAAPATGTAMESEAKGIERILKDMKVGFSFIFHHARLLFVLLALAAGIFTLGCFGPLIAVYVRDSLHASTQTYGYAGAAITAGVMVGINTLNAVAKNVKNTVLVYSGLAGIAVGLVVLTVFPHVWSTILTDFAIGFSVSGIIVPSQVMIQKETPPELMGRVGSTVMSFITTAQLAGLILSGVLAQRLGVRMTFAVCAGLLGLLIVIGRVFMEPKEIAAS